MENLLKLLVACLLLNKCICTLQNLVLPPSLQATNINGEKLNIADSSNGPRERPAPIQVQRNATAGIISSSSSSNISSSNISSNINKRTSIYINTNPHPLQLLIDALMQPQNSNQLMGGPLPRFPLNTPGKDNFLHRIGVHVLGRAQLHMNQTADTPLPFVLAELTAPPSVASIPNIDFKLSKGVQSVTPFTSSPLQLNVPNASLVAASTGSAGSFTSTRELETPSGETTESVKRLVATSTGSAGSFTSTRELETLSGATTVSDGSIRHKPSPLSTKKHQGKKPVGKLSKRRNPTANDAVERRMAMIAKMARKIDISTSTIRTAALNKASSIPSTTPQSILSTVSSISPTSASAVKIIDIPSEPILNVDSSSKVKSNLIVSKADIIDAIVKTSMNQTNSVKSPINSAATPNHKPTIPTSTTLEFTTSSLDVTSTTPLSTVTPSTTTIIENISSSSPVSITVDKSPSSMSVRSGVKLDLTQLFRQIAQAAAKKTATAAAARGENFGNIISIRSSI